MASIGLRKPYYAIYSNTKGTVSYAKGGILAKAIEFSAKIEGGKDENLYADDGISETDRTFSGGTISITTDDLTGEASCAILGITAKTITVGENKEVKEIVYDDNMVPPYIGFGVIIPKKRNGVVCYRAVVLEKIMFDIPEESAKTKSDKIEWGIPKIDGTVLRSDATGHPWKREVTVDTEELAEAYIKQCLNITEIPIV